MSKFGVAVKAMIIEDGKALLIKRRHTDVHKAGGWDIPGGRLDVGEDPYAGVMREAMEEVGLKVEVGMPVEINHFARDDGQVITMIIFVCKKLEGEVTLSEEHVAWEWVGLKDVGGKADWLERTSERVRRFGIEV